ncbi:CAP domain-containing protein [Massilia sp. TS11]|uniref:CAP domain-containing protein n=1 Tax=Massilia sp. TS11 TaxID=2908003 RepID=UPI001EDADE55|nr:CAP domain-containing protein [Massilia sp. TS11]MCG2586609.1 CAP domain-containing protein [Massilia sp. TS11]
MHWFSLLRTAVVCVAGASLVACGGGSSSSGAAPVPSAPDSGTPLGNLPGAPGLTGQIAVDGRAWINYRRGQLGVPQLTQNPAVDQAAQAHSDYQRLNGAVSHDETAGKPGYTGATLLDRLRTAGYVFGSGAYAYGEVIAGSTSSSGFAMVEDLITAIYHRFVLFEPKFKEMGAGFATGSNSYTYFTADFTANNGYGPGIGASSIVVWPADGLTGVAPNFFSDQESPDPVPGVNEVGYPISVHGDLTSFVGVKTFSVRQRGASSDLPVRLLVNSADRETPVSAAAIIPLSPLQAKTTYEVSFSGTINGLIVNKTWSFTTR